MAKPLIKDFDQKCRIRAIHSVINSVFHHEALIVNMNGKNDPVSASVYFNDCRVDLFCTGSKAKGITVDFDIYSPDNTKFSEVNGIRVPTDDASAFALDYLQNQRVHDQICLEITNAYAIYENPET
jgi:hypothetical protein